MYAAKLHSSRLQGPTERDLRSLKHTLRYIKGTTHYKVFIGRGLADYLPTTHNGFVTFPQNNILLDLRCYTDSDWAGDKTTRRSTSGWLCSLLGAPLSCASRTQSTMTLSSAEAELMALSSGMAESLRLQQLTTPTTTDRRTTDWHVYYNLQLQQQQQEVHNSLHRFYISHKFSVKAWCEPKVTPHSTMLLVDSRPMTSW